MRRINDPQFEKTYEKNSLGQTTSFESVIKADSPAASELAREIFSDFDINTHGIKWWSSFTDLGDKRRIFIGDYLWQCAISISTNLAEARLHLMELHDASDEANERIKRAVSVDAKGNASVKLPTRNSVKEELPHRLVGLHSAGLFRAMGSVLDCLAAVIIGVVGIPRNIKKADLQALKKSLPEIIEKQGLTTGNPIYEFNHRFLSIEAESGPKNWLEWTNSYRNVIVHRGRRTEFIMLLPKPSGLVSPKGAHVVSSSEIPLLVKDPDNSDVEGWLKFSGNSLLGEKSLDTFEGAFKSVRTFVELVSVDLLNVWRERKANPELILQPSNQWKMEGDDEQIFEGFNPNSIKFKVDQMRLNGVAIHRMQVAAVDDGNIQKWKTFT